MNGTGEQAGHPGQLRFEQSSALCRRGQEKPRRKSPVPPAALGIHGSVALWITLPIHAGQDSALGHTSALQSTAQAPYTIFLLLPLIFLCSFPPCFSLLFSVSISLSLSSTQKALLYFLVTLIDCINLSAYWISPAPCREHCAICL